MVEAHLLNRSLLLIHDRSRPVAFLLTHSLLWANPNRVIKIGQKNKKIGEKCSFDNELINPLMVIPFVKSTTYECKRALDRKQD